MFQLKRLPALRALEKANFGGLLKDLLLSRRIEPRDLSLETDLDLENLDTDLESFEAFGLDNLGIASVLKIDVLLRRLINVNSGAASQMTPDIIAYIFTEIFWVNPAGIHLLKDSSQMFLNWAVASLSIFKDLIRVSKSYMSLKASNALV